ncbi:hypothetical protein TCAL_16495 [Tigriopus californicus]|uniref:Ionotropic glutamate receptor C-terminal domain-containing protein n=1 Tax=Tigriopus californicus TaxID=6832 RepID=A0A553NS59_TIGCA|nr:hypothetical protein TCAL_16495 [Tigriopus californicus]
MICLLYALTFICPTLGTLISEAFMFDLQRAFQSEHRGIARPCTLLTNVITRNQNETAIILLDTYVGLDVEQVSERIQDTAWCLIAIFDTQAPNYDLDMVHIKALVEKVPDHEVFMIGSRPKDKEFGVWNKQFFWIHPVQLETYMVNAYCGREVGSFWLQNVTFWNPKSSASFPHDPNFMRACPSPLWYQRLSVGQNGIKPMACPPEPGTGREIRGTDIRAIQILAKMFQMELSFTFGNAGVTDVVNQNATELLGDLLHGDLDVVLSTVLNFVGYEVFDNTRFTFFLTIRYVTRHPRKHVAFWNVARGFDPWSWYQLKDKSLYRNPGSRVDFVLMTFTTFVEPDPLPWFPKWSTGRFIVLLWSIFAFLMVSFYLSNLRTIIIAPAYEPRIDSTQDLIKSGRELYVHVAAYYLTKLKQEGDFKVVLEKLNRDSWRFYPNEMYQSWNISKLVQDDGVVILGFPETLILNWLSLPEYEGLPNMMFSREIVHSNYQAIRLRKYSPITPELNKVLTMVHESGLYYKFLYEFVPVVALPGQYIVGQETEDAIRMSLAMLLTPLCILGIGVTLASICFIFELIHFGCTHTKKIKSNRAIKTAT